MKLIKNLPIFVALLTIFFISSCSTTEKMTIYVPNGTRIYTPNNTLSPAETASGNERVNLVVPSDMYCGYVLAQTQGTNVKIPLGLDYKKKSHLGTKAAFYSGFGLASIGLGGTMGGCIGLIASTDDEDASSVMGTVAGAGMALVGIGAALGAPAQSRLRQTAYDYNFGYEKTQKFYIPQLQFTLIHPNPPKGYDESAEQKKQSSTRKKASSGESTVPETTIGSKVSKSRTDNAKKIEGRYVGTGKLLLGKTIDEKYSEITVLLERIDKSHVSVRILEDNEDYFDAPLIYEVKKDKNGRYNLSIDELPEAVIQITANSKLTFSHKKVNIESTIYTLEIMADKK